MLKKVNSQELFEELNINLDIVPLEELADYTAVFYFLTIEDEPPQNSTNLEKVNRYLQAFDHLQNIQKLNQALKIFKNKT